MTTFDELLNSYRAVSESERDKGTRFEQLMRHFLQTYPPYLGKFADVWLWHEFPFRADFGGRDIGIDIVAKTTDGEYWAVQCKCYAETTRIDKPAVDSFLSASSRKFSGNSFSTRLWISTTNNWNDTAEITIQNQIPPVLRISLQDLQEAAVDWEKLDAGVNGDNAVNKTREPLQHQLDAITSAHEHFHNHDRGKMIMSCGTGKTYTALKIAERETESHGKILYLVPSIALISQTLLEWSTFAEKPLHSICVCSDETASKGRIEDSQQHVDLALPATTDVDKIVKQLNHNHSGMTVVFSTYQSLDKVAAAQKLLNFNFDLIICDEAHRTTGYGTDTTAFTQVHDENFIRARKRLYMTATPRLYTSDAKKKAADKDLMLWSMDDAAIYGEEFYHISFGDAVEKNLLSDYKVIVLTVSANVIPAAVQEALSNNAQINLDDVAKLIGCINALSKRMVNITEMLTVDPAPMHKAVAFCAKITASKKIADIFNQLHNFDEQTVTVSAQHVDGTMSATTRETHLAWLKNTPANTNDCRVLTNVRCLSEGVDVPSLDAVLFLSPRKSKVEIVQAVGRVMRKSPGKQYGYIIIPAVVAIDRSPEDVLAESPDFATVWDVLNALRAHDTRMDIFIQELAMRKSSRHILIGKTSDTPAKVFQPTFKFEDLQGAIYARMVERVGNRRYWEQWAKDIAVIADRHKTQILQLIQSGDHKREFDNFLSDLRGNLNNTITQTDAVEMLAQHIITRPVFEALFDNYSFAKNNAVSKSMQNLINLIDTDNDNDQLDKFYHSVRQRCAIATTAEQRQAIIIELYDKFFKTALPLTVEKLGIVYTPVEVVDFIIRSVNDVLKRNFNKTLSDRNVHILDPFTGTGTFLVRLLQSGLIQRKDLLRKYQNELHANEIVLLAYYIAAINIENAFHDAAGVKDFYPFDGICLTDTFRQYEDKDVDDSFKRGLLIDNSERIEEQIHTQIRVIIGNPPYSVGQRSANDNAQNVYYAKLEQRIADTYAKATNATNKNSLYDSYIKAFRWASDRIGDSGIIGFITNSGWIDKDALTGFRKCIEEDFSSIYVFNLRGDIRGKMGDNARRAGQNIFPIMTGVAITVLVKNPAAQKSKAEIHYCDVGEYLSREEKIAKIQSLHSVLNEAFTIITPNEKGDWINQRGNVFDNYILLGDKKNHNLQTVFCEYYGKGLLTARDSWCYNYSRDSLVRNINTTIDYYNSHTSKDIDSTKFVWNRSSAQHKSRKVEYRFDDAKIVESIYRPFCKQYLYYDKYLNEMTYQMPRLFPTGSEDNVVICVPGHGNRKDFSVFIVNRITESCIEHGTQCFPLYWYERDESGLFGEVRRRDGVTDFILNQARSLYGGNVTKEDIFYYVYGFLHLRGYRAAFDADLKKSLPRIFLVDDVQKFWRLSKAGRDMAEIHLNYEKQPPPAQVDVVDDGGGYRVRKMKFAKDDRSTLLYNEHVTVRNIPLRSYEYVVNGRSPLEWVMDRYQVRVDKASGIVNDPNDWGGERYILNLILSCITVSLKTLDIVDSLPSIEFV